jgi:hypothetical protein
MPYIYLPRQERISANLLGKLLIGAALLIAASSYMFGSSKSSAVGENRVPAVSQKKASTIMRSRNIRQRKYEE